jgi:hypothetical protein
VPGAPAPPLPPLPPLSVPLSPVTASRDLPPQERKIVTERRIKPRLLNMVTVLLKC